MLATTTSPTSNKKEELPLEMGRVASIILGGGQGTRLFPLTLTRCKPAICFGGRYRLIDIPMSNSINSGCLKIFIITQFLSSSLHRHIFKSYRMGTFSPGFIELLPVEEKPKNKNWFQGTADAVRQNMEYFIETAVDYFLILSGDQLYNMNFQHMLRQAKSSDADLVIASLPVSEEETKRLGILKIDQSQKVIGFCEKPQDTSQLEGYEIPNNLGGGESYRPYLGSMGIYLFKRECLFKMLTQDARDDFGKHIIPNKVQQGNVYTYIHNDYWEDIGTIESFYQANISLTNRRPDLYWHDENQPIFTSSSNLPGPKLLNAHVHSSIICEGSIIEGEISNSILGTRSIVKKGTAIHDSYLMGNDFYFPPAFAKHLPTELCIDENCVIKKAIIDKNVYIGKGVKLINKNNLMNYNSDDIYIRDGIIIVTRGASIPSGFVL